MKFLDLTGQKYGKLTVIERAENKNNHVFWKCKCDCGKYVVVQSAMLRTNHTKSCGCLINGSYNITHGMTHTRLYRVWANVKQRCCYKKATAYYKYGAKGVEMCDEWKNSFESFMKWALDNGYTDKLSIDRIDNSKGYSPDNCRWITMKQQQNNKRNNVKVEIDGDVHTLSEWCDIYRIKYHCVQYKIHHNGMSYKDAILSEKEKCKV